VNAGANIFARRKWMQTLLHLAVERGHLEAVQTILQIAGSNQISESGPIAQQIDRLRARHIEAKDDKARIAKQISSREYQRSQQNLHGSG
jgi:hypothetical protein